MWNDLSENLQRQLVLTQEPAEQVILLNRLGNLRETKLSDRVQAVDTYRQVLELDPMNDEARGALENLIKQPELELDVAGILEPIYKHRSDWANLIGVYEIMVRHSSDSVRKIELLHEIARLYEEGREDGLNAFLTYARALREDPAREETQQHLERLAVALTRWQDLVNLYAEVVEKATDNFELQVHLWTRIAQIYEGNLGDNDQAALAYHKVLTVDTARSVGSAWFCSARS